VIPPGANAVFVAAMEDVLETYQKPRDPERPLVCLDETSKQLVIETRKPIPAKPGQPIRYDYEWSSTRSRTFGNMCATTASRTGSSKATMTSSIIAASMGTNSSTVPGS
jgi:hypothetical protein